MIIVYILGSVLLTTSYTSSYVINTDRDSLGYINGNEDAETNPYSLYLQNNLPSPYPPVTNPYRYYGHNYVPTSYPPVTNAYRFYGQNNVPYSPVNYAVPSYFQKYLLSPDLSLNQIQPETSSLVDNSHIPDIAWSNYDRYPESHEYSYIGGDNNADREWKSGFNGKATTFSIKKERGPVQINADLSFVPSENSNENYQKYETPNEGILTNTPTKLDKQIIDKDFSTPYTTLGNVFYSQKYTDKDSGKDSGSDKSKSSSKSTPGAQLSKGVKPSDHTSPTLVEVTTTMNNQNKSQKHNLKKESPTNRKGGLGDLLFEGLKYVGDTLGETAHQGIKSLFNKISNRNLVGLLEDNEQESSTNTTDADTQSDNPEGSEDNNQEDIDDGSKKLSKLRTLTDILRLLEDFQEESNIDTILSGTGLDNQYESQESNLEEKLGTNARGIWGSIFTDVASSVIYDGIKKLFGMRSLTNLPRLLEDFEEESNIATILSGTGLDSSQESNLEEKVGTNTRGILGSLFTNIISSAIYDGIQYVTNKIFQKRSLTNLRRLLKDFEEEFNVDTILSDTELDDQESSLEEEPTAIARSILGIIGGALFGIAKLVAKTVVGKAIISGIKKIFKKRALGTLTRLLEDSEETPITNPFQEETVEFGTESYNRESTLEEKPTAIARSILGIIGGALFGIAKLVAKTVVGKAIISGIKKIFKKRALGNLTRLLEDSEETPIINPFQEESVELGTESYNQESTLEEKPTAIARSILGIIGGALFGIAKLAAKTVAGKAIISLITNRSKTGTLGILPRLLEDSEENPTINTRIKDIFPIGWILPPSSFLTGRPMKWIKDIGAYKTGNTDDKENWEEFVVNKHLIDEKGSFDVEINSNSNEREHVLKIKVSKKSPEQILIAEMDKYIYDLYKTLKDINKQSKKGKKTTRVRRDLQNKDPVGLRHSLELSDNTKIDDDLETPLQDYSYYYGNEDILRDNLLNTPSKLDKSVLQQIFFNVLYSNKYLEDISWFDRRKIKPLFLNYIQSLSNTYLSPDMKIDLINLRNYIAMGYFNHVYYGVEEPTVLEVINELMTTVNNIIFKHQNDQEMMQEINEQHDKNEKTIFFVIKRFKLDKSSLFIKITSSFKAQYVVDIELLHTSAEPFATRDAINKYFKPTLKLFKSAKEPVQKIKDHMKNLVDVKKLVPVNFAAVKNPGKSPNINKTKDADLKQRSKYANEDKLVEDFIDEKLLDLESDEDEDSYSYTESSFENGSFLTTGDIVYRDINVKKILSKILPTNTILHQIDVFKKKHFGSPLNVKRGENVNDVLEKMKKILKKLRLYLLFTKKNLVGKGQHLLFEQIDQLLRLQESYADSLENIIQPDNNDGSLFKYLHFRKSPQDSIQNDAEQSPENLEDQEQVKLNVNTLDQLLQLQGTYLDGLDDKFEAVALFNDNSLKPPFQEENKGPKQNVLKNVLSKLQQINKLMKLLNVVKQKRFQSHLKDEVRHHIIDMFGNMKKVLFELKTYVGGDKYKITLSANADSVQDELQGKPEALKSQQSNGVDVNQIDKLLRLQESYADSLQGVFEAEGIHTQNVDDDLKTSSKNESSIEKPSENNLDDTPQDTADQTSMLDQLIGVQERYVDRLYDMFEAEQHYVEKHTSDLDQQSSGRKRILSTRENILEHIIPQVIFINHQLNDLRDLKRKDLVSPVNGNHIEMIVDLLKNMKSILEELKQFMGATKFSFDSLLKDKTLVDNQQSLKDQEQNLFELDKIDQIIRIQVSYADSLEDLINGENRQNDDNLDDDLKKRPREESSVKPIPPNLQNEDKLWRNIKAVDQLLTLQQSYLDSLDDVLQDEELDNGSGNVKQISPNETTSDIKSPEKDEQKTRSMGNEQPHMDDLNTIDQFLRLQDNYNKLSDIFADVELNNDDFDDLKPAQNESSTTPPVSPVEPQNNKTNKLLVRPKVLVKNEVLKRIQYMLKQINQLLIDPKSYKQKRTKLRPKPPILRNAFIPAHQSTSTLQHAAKKKAQSADKKSENNKKDKLRANSNGNKRLEHDAGGKAQKEERKKIADNKKLNLTVNSNDLNTLQHDAERKKQSAGHGKIEDNKKLNLTANSNDHNTLQHDAERKKQSEEAGKIGDNKKFTHHYRSQQDAETKTLRADNKKLKPTANSNDNKTLDHDAERKTQNEEDEKKLRLTTNSNDNNTLEHDAERKTQIAEEEKLDNIKQDNLKLTANNNDNNTLEHNAERKTQSREDKKIKDHKKLTPLTNSSDDNTLEHDAERKTQTAEEEKLDNEQDNLKLTANNNDNNTLEHNAERKTQSREDEKIEDDKKLPLLTNSKDDNTLEQDAVISTPIKTVGDGKPENLKNEELERSETEEFKANTTTDISQKGGDEKQKNLEHKVLEQNEIDKFLPAANTSNTNTLNKDVHETRQNLDNEVSEHNEKENTNKSNTSKNDYDEKQENLEDGQSELDETDDNYDDGAPEDLEDKHLERDENVASTNDTNTDEDKVEDQVLPTSYNNKRSFISHANYGKNGQNVEDQKLKEEKEEGEDNINDNSVPTASKNDTNTLKNDFSNNPQNDKGVETNVNVTNTLENDAERHSQNLEDKELEDNNQDKLVVKKNAIEEEETPRSRSLPRLKSKFREIRKKKNKNRNDKLNKNKNNKDKKEKKDKKDNKVRKDKKDKDKAKKTHVRKEKQKNSGKDKISKKKNRLIIPVENDADVDVPPQVEIEDNDNPSSQLTNPEGSVDIKLPDENNPSATIVPKPEPVVTHTEPPPPNVMQDLSVTHTELPPPNVMQDLPVSHTEPKPPNVMPDLPVTHTEPPPSNKMQDLPVTHAELPPPNVMQEVSVTHAEPPPPNVMHDLPLTHAELPPPNVMQEVSVTHAEPPPPNVMQDLPLTHAESPTPNVIHDASVTHTEPPPPNLLQETMETQNPNDAIDFKIFREPENRNKSTSISN
ncbi:uncharacterized protein PF3D7_1120600-like isoform X2 [Diabrotica virgifera virgifera]|uniref:Uncharacterized protein n=1 Tax=Diabrotica virgifera virgifera TaxID=50390 RepID=A0ABM5K0P8_DIAVI|nr:uncharacterized protein PF3D7_1120600-like isoform X2 [Diabrotica virgifera virgifera]